MSDANESPAVAPSQADRRAAVNLLVPHEHHELLAAWVEDGHMRFIGFDLVGEQLPRAAQAFAQCRREEREAICTLLKGEPDQAETRFERAVNKLSERVSELPTWLCLLLAEACEAGAEELAEWQRKIRARDQETTRA